MGRCRPSTTRSSSGFGRGRASAGSTWRPGPAPSRCAPARAGAEVTGLDLAPGLIETAKRLATERRLTVRFDVGDVERLPYGDASFGIAASSAHGVVFAVDHVAVAAELARVCRPGGRLGLPDWLPNPELQRLMERVGYTRPDGAGRPGVDWARRDYATDLLGEHFELDFAEVVCPWTGESGEALWQLFLRADGSLRRVSPRCRTASARRSKATGSSTSSATGASPASYSAT